MYLAIVLSRLDDFENSCSAYDKALELGSDFLVHLNYAITLFLNDEVEQSKSQFKYFENLLNNFVTTTLDIDPDINHQAGVLRQLLSAPS